MAITLHTFATTAEFETFRWDFIKRAEGVRTAPYVDGVGVPTIGVGFNLRDAAIRDLVFKSIKWVPNDGRLTPADQLINNTFITRLTTAVDKKYVAEDDATLQSAINGILAQRAQALSSYSFIASNTAMVLPEVQMPPIFLLAVPDYHRRVRAALGLSPTEWPNESREMVALTSMAYQGTLSRIKASLSEAIANGDRAEAWFQIRYKAQVTGPGDRGRHFAEAQNFGLYDGANTGNPSISAAESKTTYKMLNAHRAEILDYEASYGSAAASNAASRFVVNTVDVQLVNLLTPAYTAFITYANTLQGAGLAGIDTSIISNAAAIYFQGDNAFTTLLDARVDDARTGNKLNNNLLVGGAGKDTEYGGAGSDYLIGAAGWDILDGGTGDDVLVGGKDNDRLIGGAGMDTYAFNTGDGQDTIEDSDGNGRIVIGSTTLTGAGSAKYKLDGHKSLGSGLAIKQITN